MYRRDSLDDERGDENCRPSTPDALTHRRLLHPEGREEFATSHLGAESCEKAEVEMSHRSGEINTQWDAEFHTGLMHAEGGFRGTASDPESDEHPAIPDVDAVMARADGAQEALNKIGNGRYQLLIFCVCGLAWSADGCLLAALPLSMPILEQQWNLSPASQAALLSSIGLGETIGALCFGALSDRLGRRTTLALAEMLCVTFALASFFAYEFWSLLLCQLLMGCAVGGSIPIAFSLLVESLADTHKDMVLCMMQMWFKAGMVIDTLLGWILVKYGWRMLMLASGVPPLIVLAPLLLFVEESPVHLHNQRQKAEVTRVLRKIAKWNGCMTVADGVSVTRSGHETTTETPAISMDTADCDVERIPIILADSTQPGIQVDHSATVDQDSAIANGNRLASNVRTSPVGRYLAIVVQKVTMRTAFMWLSINLASGLYLWYPAIATHMGAGTVGEFGGSLAANLVGIVAFVLAAFTTERFGHARLIVSSCLVCAVACGAMSLGIAVSSVAMLAASYILWMFFFDIAWPVIYAVSPQMFDPKIRTTAFGFASGFGKLGVLIAPWLRVFTGSNLGSSSSSSSSSASSSSSSSSSSSPSSSFEYLVLIYGVFWIVTGQLAFTLRKFMPMHRKAADTE